MSSADHPETGLTLLEILLVVLLLGILGASLVHLPRSTAMATRTEAAASEVAAALRFARGEAIRTGAPHGVRVQTSDHRVRVYRLDTTGAPPVEQYGVDHPVDKKPYDLDLAQAPLTVGVEVRVSQFQFASGGPAGESVAFDAEGSPRSPADLSLLTDGVVTVGLGSVERTIRLEAVTGRVVWP